MFKLWRAAMRRRRQYPRQFFPLPRRLSPVDCGASSDAEALARDRGGAITSDHIRPCFATMALASRPAIARSFSKGDARRDSTLANLACSCADKEPQPPRSDMILSNRRRTYETWDGMGAPCGSTKYCNLGHFFNRIRPNPGENCEIIVPKQKNRLLHFVDERHLSRSGRTNRAAPYPGMRTIIDEIPCTKLENTRFGSSTSSMSGNRFTISSHRIVSCNSARRLPTQR